MYKAVLLTSSFVLQFIVAFFLVTDIIFWDSSPSEPETITYFFLALPPHVIALLLYFWKSTEKSLYVAGGLYLLSLIVLIFIPSIEDFYVTGNGGVPLFVGILVMGIHFLIFFLTISLLKKSKNK